MVNNAIAELLRGKAIEIDRVNAVDPGQGYLIADIIGCKLTDEKGKVIYVYRILHGSGNIEAINLLDNTDKHRFSHDTKEPISRLVFP